MNKISSLVLTAAILAGSVTAAVAATGRIYTTDRISGANRYQTAAAVAQKSITGKINNIVVATGEAFPDALSASLLAKKLNAPIFLVDSKDNSQLAAFITKNLSSNGKLYIVGGTGAISDSFVAGLGVDFERISGAGRYETNNAINDKIAAPVGTPVILATGEDFPDALSMSSISAIKGYPIVLTSKNSLPGAADRYLFTMKPSTIYIAGGIGAIGDNVEERLVAYTRGTEELAKTKIVRISGDDRYSTSVAVAKYFNLDTTNAVLATGGAFPDALAGSALASKLNAPIILTPKADPTDQKVYLDSTKITDLTILGGKGAINENAENFFKGIALPAVPEGKVLGADGIFYPEAYVAPAVTGTSVGLETQYNVPTVSGHYTTVAPLSFFKYFGAQNDGAYTRAGDHSQCYAIYNLKTNEIEASAKYQPDNGVNIADSPIVWSTVAYKLIAAGTFSASETSAIEASVKSALAGSASALKTLQSQVTLARYESVVTSMTGKGLAVLPWTTYAISGVQAVKIVAYAVKNYPTLINMLENYPALTTGDNTFADKLGSTLVAHETHHVTYKQASGDYDFMYVNTKTPFVMLAVKYGSSNSKSFNVLAYDTYNFMNR